MEIKDMLEWAHLDGLSEEELLEKIAQTKDELDDEVENALHMIGACTARLTAMHLSRA